MKRDDIAKRAKGVSFKKKTLESLVAFGAAIGG